MTLYTIITISVGNNIELLHHNWNTVWASDGMDFPRQFGRLHNLADSKRLLYRVYFFGQRLRSQCRDEGNSSDMERDAKGKCAETLKTKAAKKAALNDCENNLKRDSSIFRPNRCEYGSTSCDEHGPLEGEAKEKPGDLLKTTIGDFGIWQFKISLLMALLKFPIAWFQLSIVFLAPPTSFRCASPNHQLHDELNFISPKFDIKHEGLNTGYCEMIDPEDMHKTLPCVFGYDYNRTVFHSTIITEWDLVCGHQRLIDLAQITLMLGVIIGNILFGVLADRRGRKTVLMTCICLQSLFGMICAWVPWYWGFVIARLMLGISNGGTMVTSFVMCMEVVGGKWRTIVPILYQIPFGFGNSIMSGIAYYLRDWRYFQTAISVLSMFYIVYIWLIPESPRWLVAVGKTEEAMVILKEAAICNDIDPQTVSEAMTDYSNIPSNNKKNKSSFAALFKTSNLRKRSSLLCLNWTIAGITFYAFSQYLGHVSQNLYLTVAFGGLIALPGILFCIYVVDHFGRRVTIACANLLTALCFVAIIFVPRGRTIAGITFYAFSQYLGHVSQNLYLTVAFGGLIALPGTLFCIYVVDHFGRRVTIACANLLTALCFVAIIFVPRGRFAHDWPRIAFSGLGIVGLSISMPALYLFTGELFPTVIRNAGVGASVMFSRMGSMVAPLVIALEGTSTILPLLFLALAAIVEAVLVLPLPETKGQSLPETVEDVERKKMQPPDPEYENIPKEEFEN
ncbi:unnamed protein product [Brassicogethes aeneus]|uniref:Major facilitator superfamily (MFS) profile domain-containing protein n=1 Tax=Brassicogethes aeneus TaxID=1431903 RepID=A0A9P0BBL1_BRAAE|nr:unnamed protein product [Brassicogethes aeneus]